MAEEEAAGSAGAGFKALFSKKVGGIPLPVFIGAGILLYLYLRKKNAGSGASSSTSQTDPAGNVGTIDPATGYVEGSSEDTAALAANNNGSGSTDSSSNNSTTAGQYATNEDWARAAINFLVGIGVDATSANSAITQYVDSQTLTTEQQGDVNLAIQALGSPPDPPEPGNAPPPVVTPPSGTTYATNPPTGLTVSSKTANTLAVKWNNTSNAQAYTVTYKTGSAAAQTQTVSATAGTSTLTGLTPGTLYSISVQATPAKPGDPSATTTATTTSTAVTPPPTKPAPPTGVGKTATHVYIVKKGDTLSGIAAANKTTLAEIKTLNPVYWTNPKYKNGDYIVSGDKVTLPGA